jgi:hypothetical protein
MVKAENRVISDRPLRLCLLKKQVDAHGEQCLKGRKGIVGNTHKVGTFRLFEIHKNIVISRQKRPFCKISIYNL